MTEMWRHLRSKEYSELRQTGTCIMNKTLGAGGDTAWTSCSDVGLWGPTSVSK